MSFSLQVLINYYRATVHVTGVNWAIKQRALYHWSNLFDTIYKSVQFL